VHLQKQLEQDAIFTGNATTVFQSPVTADWLIALIGEVQALNGEYVLNCSRKIAEAIRQQLRQQANRMLDECIVKREELLNVQRSEIEAERAVYANLLLSVERLRNLLDENEAHLQALTALIPFQYESVKLHLPEAVVLHTKTNASEQNDVQLSTSTNQQAWIEPELVQADRAAHTSLVENLQQLAVQIEEYPWLTSFRQELIERARRMNNQSYIFALFGAFSAGKSSFANALLGAPVLPVSPNPTTAAINKIVPVSDDHPHQNAYITMKTSEALFADVQFALRMLGYEPATFEAALHTIEQLKEADIVAKAKPHFSFLKAVERGLQETEALRGTRWLADFEQFKAYAASEWLSCFVEEIAFAYDCPLTAAGVRLVDTPGADSIHARHTGVAFKFIKEADALFFVTYYNHAFSHADKEFLQQLGRVKDQFALDKMFFVINAADLASDDAERQTVVDYVRGQLQVNGVREPRIFPLSSLYGLQAKLRKDASEYETSGFKQLEQALGTFIQQEMHTLTQNNALQLLQKLTVRLENWLTLQQQDAATFEAQRLSQLQAIATFESTDERKQVVAYGERLTREMNELLFHLKNRIQYRFGEWFIAAFHPSLWSTGSKDNGRILNQAWQEFIAQLSFAISQEMLANTLRIEREMQRMITQCAEQWMARVQQQMANFTFELPDWQQVPTPTVLERVESANIEPAYFTRYFKNPKSFFEGDGRNHLRADLEPKVTSLISQYVEWHVENWTTFYQEQLKAAFEPLLANYYAELEMAKVSLSQTQPTDTEKQVIEQVLTFVKKCGG
jgi:hypothetical protein